MEVILAIVFVAGYMAIALEHPLRINKTATALLLGVFCWLLYLFAAKTDPANSLHQLSEHLAGISEILFFLMGAMTIVELIDTHKGFRIVTDAISTTSKVKLLWIISTVTFFLSAVLDNLTTAIVMTSLLRQLVPEKKDRMTMAGMVVIAANAGGAWSPIGDVTTTMLWIGGQVTALNIVKELFLPGVVCTIVPLGLQSLFIKGHLAVAAKVDRPAPEPYSALVFYTGIGVLLFVPVFKTVTHLPPYMGMFFGLGVLWVLTELIHASDKNRRHLLVSSVLSKIDLTSILFFCGILLAVAALEAAGLLHVLAVWLDQQVANQEVVVTLLGLISSVVDNVPLVAGVMGMYPLHEFPADSKLWEMIALCAGTGGSILIIGSAAGVVVMGMEKIEFFSYLKKTGAYALVGYAAGVLTYLLIVGFL